MKSALFIFALVLSTSAHALSVGDSATYTLTVQGQAHEANLLVTAINGDTYSAQATVDGQVNPTASSGSVAQMNQLASIVPNCAQYGGTPVALATPAGTISTCHITSQGNEIYAADVPFGIAKLSAPGQEMLLKSFIKH